MIEHMIAAALRTAAAEMKAWVREELRQRFGRFILRTAVSTAQEGGALADVVEGYGSEQANDPARMDARRVEAPGFLCIPVAKGAALLLCNGANSPYWPLASSRYRPTDGKAGEFCVHTLTDVAKQVRLWGRQSGDATLEPSATGKVYLGTATPAEADAVALYTQLKADFDAFVSRYNGHTHPVNGVQAGMATVTAAATTSPAGQLSPNVAAANVRAKKP